MFLKVIIPFSVCSWDSAAMHPPFCRQTVALQSCHKWLVRIQCYKKPRKKCNNYGAKLTFKKSYKMLQNQKQILKLKEEIPYP